MTGRGRSRRWHGERNRRQRGRRADKERGTPLSECEDNFDNYLLLNESQEEDLLSFLDRCLSALRQNDSRKFTNELVPHVIDLKSTIDAKLSIFTSEQLANSSETGFDSLLTCRYCGIECQTCDWKNHILQRCDYAAPPKVRKTVGIYKISGNGIECLLCGETCSSIDDKRAHDDSFVHLLTLKNVSDNIDPHSIFCSFCRVYIPNNNAQCVFHLKSLKHGLLSRSYLDWYRQGVRYVSFNSNIRCLTCNKYLKRNVVQSHHSLTHQAENTRKFGLSNISSPENVWCHACCCEFDTSQFESHQCSLSALEFHCQTCSASEFGVTSFALHVQGCTAQASVPDDTSSVVSEACSVETESIDTPIFSNTNFSKETVFCYYCGAKCLEANLSKHLSFECQSASALDMFGNGKRSLYRLSLKGLECVVCAVFCNDSDRKEHHDNFSGHLNAVKRADKIDVESIFCVDCQERIPNKTSLCHEHVTSMRHKKLAVDRFHWFRGKVMHLDYGKHIRCLSCLRNIKKEDIRDHHIAWHTSNEINKGLENVCFDRVWCSFCDCKLSTSDILSHTPLNCSKSIQNNYCQVCDGISQGDLAMHVENCFGRRKPSRVGYFKFVDDSDTADSSQVQCFYCTRNVIKSKLHDHFNFECTGLHNASKRFDPLFKKHGKRSIFKLTYKGAECNPCGTVLSSLPELEKHQMSRGHSKKYESKVNEFDENVIFCLICQESIPCYDHLNYCIGHLKSSRHKLLLNDRFYFSLRDIRYIAQASNARCLTCNKNFDFCELRQHHSAQHNTGALGIFEVSPDKIWCSCCNDVKGLADFERHFSSVCEKSLQVRYCQLCNSCIEGNVSFLKHMQKCQFPTEIPNLSSGFHLAISDSDQSSSDRTVCNGCGLSISSNDLAKHLGLECKNPLNPVIKTRGKKSLYRLTYRGLGCNFCNDENISSIEDHEISYDHSHKIPNNFDSETIFCIVCQEALHASADVDLHRDTTRHRKLSQRKQSWLSDNVGYLGYGKKVRCVQCNFSCTDDSFCAHGNDCSTPLNVWCSYCDSTIYVRHYFEHTAICKRGLLSFSCQLCKKVFEKRSFKEHLTSCVAHKLRPYLSEPSVTASSHQSRTSASLASHHSSTSSLPSRGVRTSLPTYNPSSTSSSATAGSASKSFPHQSSAFATFSRQPSHSSFTSSASRTYSSQPSHSSSSSSTQSASRTYSSSSYTRSASSTFPSQPSYPSNHTSTRSAPSTPGQSSIPQTPTKDCNIL